MSTSEEKTYRQRLGEFQNFELRLRSSGLAHWYTFFQLTSADAHPSAEAIKNYIELGRGVRLSAVPSEKLVLGLPFVLALAAGAVGKLQEYCDAVDESVGEAV